jgi:hypothetical protein
LHTVATALGNSVKAITRDMSVHPATAAYMVICLEDNETLLKEINEEFRRKARSEMVD